MKTFDVVVIGLGGVGSAAAFHLATQGARVLGVERFTAAHDLGSSHGHTRAIRKAYFEHPDYVPLLHEAYRLWRELEQRCGRQLLYETGLLQVGPPDGNVIRGVLHSAQRHGLDVQQLDADQSRQRFPGFTIPTGMTAVFEPSGGYLLVEDCIREHLRLAAEAGARLVFETTVDSWRATESGVILSVSGETISAASAVVTTGAWAVPMLESWGVPACVLRKHLHWFASPRDSYRQDRGSPVFLYETPQGIFYGFPQVDSRGVKVAEHGGGERIADPMMLERSPDAVERERVISFLQRHLPGVSAQSTGHATCMYTMTPDGHFVVDQHPDYRHVVIAAGLSGHGFKFASVLGRILADLAWQGQTDLPVEFLGLKRFATSQ